MIDAKKVIHSARPNSNRRTYGSRMVIVWKVLCSSQWSISNQFHEDDMTESKRRTNDFGKSHEDENNVEIPNVRQNVEDGHRER